MFTTIIVQPIFNLLVFIYAILPGHNFGLAIIIFTLIVRILLWPLVKKQLHHTKEMRKLQPELKRIKQQTKGDRQKESMLTMELYKERGINPFSTLGITIVQLPILIGLYIGLRKLILDPHQLIEFSYPFVRNLSWIKEVGSDISKFDATLFGFVDLARPALKDGVWYFPALVLVFLSAFMQYLQSKQLMPSPKDGKGLKQILKDASSGKQADTGEMQAATGRFTTMMIPIFIFFVTLGIASALSLYWFTSSFIAYFQQDRVLREDEEEMEELADKKNGKQVIEGEVIEKKTPKPKAKKSSKTAKKAKRRKRA